jgi:hypothetical protein
MCSFRANDQEAKGLPHKRTTADCYCSSTDESVIKLFRQLPPRHGADTLPAPRHVLPQQQLSEPLFLYHHLRRRKSIKIEPHASPPYSLLLLVLSLSLSPSLQIRFSIHLDLFKYVVVDGWICKRGGEGRTWRTRSNNSRKCQALGILLDFNVNARTEDEHQRSCLKGRDGNSGTGNQYSVGTRPDGYGYDFLPVGETRTRLEPRRIQVFFPTRG